MLSLVTLMLTGFCASAATDAKALLSDYEEKKSQLERFEAVQRNVMSRLYEITQRMKGYSKRRQVLNMKMFYAEGNVKELARQTAQLEAKLDSQKGRLSQRLRAIYMLGDEGLARAIFSSASGQELDQTLRYLKKVSEYDFNMIKSYQKDLRDLESKRQRLNKEVRNLLALKNGIGEQESRLAKEQTAKSALLTKLKTDRQSTAKAISGIRRLAEKMDFAELLDTSFFEFKGNLKAPVQGRVIRPFGLFEDEEFHYRLAHKGLLFRVKPGSHVRSIHAGRVAFADSVKGHGMTLVVDHGDHYYSVYALNDAVLVKAGDRVTAGQNLAETSDHSYFEIRHFSDAIDPQPWLNAEGASS